VPVISDRLVSALAAISAYIMNCVSSPGVTTPSNTALEPHQARTTTAAVLRKDMPASSTARVTRRLTSERYESSARRPYCADCVGSCTKLLIVLVAPSASVAIADISAIVSVACRDWRRNRRA